MKVRAEAKPLTTPLAGGREGTTVAVEPLQVGRMHAPKEFFESSKRLPLLRMLGLGVPRSKYVGFPIPAYLIHHPSGPFVVDTGLHPSVSAQPSANLGRIYGSFSHPELEPGDDLPAQLRARGIDPRAIRTIVMTHMHFDHTSGMSEFPGATFYVAENEWQAATTERRPIMEGYRPAHYDYAFDYRTISYDSELVRSYSTFGRTFDLFGDGSVRLASTPGHSAGHQSVICRLRDRDLVIAGDAIYTYAQLEGAPEPPRPFDRHTWRRSLGELRHFHAQYPQAVILPGHDGEHWKTVEKRYE
jgi:glyoxylase-like metal-dependent hydrolase (beta-lactamase superfamily II)